MKKILLVCCASLVTHASFAQTLILDSTFAVNGFHKDIAPGNSSQYADVLALNDGKIHGVIIEHYNGEDGRTFVVRHNANGTLDNTYGVGGVSSKIDVPNHYTYLQHMARQSDGKIVACGRSQNNLVANDNDCIVVRYNTDGTLDNTFGVGGITKVLDSWPTTNLSPNGISIQADGKILLAIQSTSDSSSFVRLNPNGQLDPTFGDGGVAIPQALLGLYYENVLSLSDGKILGLGYRSLTGTEDQRYLVVYRLLANGTLDNSFGTGGIYKFQQTNTSVHARVIAVQSTGKIIIGGMIYNDAPGSLSNNLLIRLNADGTIDNTFADGSGYKTFNHGSLDNEIRDFKITNDDKITIVVQKNTEEPNASIVIFRYNNDGSPDMTFNSGVQFRSITELPVAEGAGIDIQSDGKILFCGVEGNSDWTEGKSVLGRLKYNTSTHIDNDALINTKVYPNIIKAGEYISIVNGEWIHSATLVSLTGAQYPLVINKAKVQIPQSISSGMYQITLSGDAVRHSVPVVVR